MCDTMQLMLAGLAGMGATMVEKAGFDAIGRGEKVRLTLWLEPSVRDSLKAQAASLGVSASAYVSVLVGERMKDESGKNNA